MPCTNLVTFWAKSPNDKMLEVVMDHFEIENSIAQVILKLLGINWTKPEETVNDELEEAREQNPDTNDHYLASVLYQKLDDYLYIYDLDEEGDLYVFREGQRDRMQFGTSDAAQEAADEQAIQMFDERMPNLIEDPDKIEELIKAWRNGQDFKDYVTEGADIADLAEDNNYNETNINGITYAYWKVS